LGNASFKSRRAAGQLSRALLDDAEKSLNLRQRRPGFQRGAKLTYGIGIRASEEQHYAEIAAGIHVTGVEGNDGFKLGRR